MIIGLLDIDCHSAKKKNGEMIYPNIALCKIAAWHKQKGDVVEWANPFDHYDILYRSKIFNFTPDDLRIYNCDKEVRGGTGYNIQSMLPQDIDDMQPDLSIYPHIPADTSYGFLTRGCPNKCNWCVVPKKEGAIHPYWDIDRVANGRKNVVLMDNNILAAGRYCMEQLRKIIDRGYRVDFNQALDARLVNEENAALLAKVKWLNNTIRFGCDTKRQIGHCEKAMFLLKKNGFKGVFFLYTMLTSDFNESFSRIDFWRNQTIAYRKNKIGYEAYPHAQPFRDTTNPRNLPPQWQHDLARWTNLRSVFLSTPFEYYQPRKGFTCDYYFS